MKEDFLDCIHDGLLYQYVEHLNGGQILGNEKKLVWDLEMCGLRETI